MAYVEAVQGKKYVPAAMAKTQRMRAVTTRSRLSRLNLAIPIYDRKRWEEAVVRQHLPSLTALISQVMGRECDRLGIK